MGTYVLPEQCNWVLFSRVPWSLVTMAPFMRGLILIRYINYILKTNAVLGNNIFVSIKIINIKKMYRLNEMMQRVPRVKSVDA